MLPDFNPPAWNIKLGLCRITLCNKRVFGQKISYNGNVKYLKIVTPTLGTFYDHFRYIRQYSDNTALRIFYLLQKQWGTESILYLLFVTVVC